MPFDPFAYEITLAWSMALIYCVQIYLSLFIKARFARFAGSFQQVSFILETTEMTCMTVIKIYKHWPKFFCVRSILTLKNVRSDNNSIQNYLIPKFNAKQFINGLSFSFHWRISLMSFSNLQILSNFKTRLKLKIKGKKSSLWIFALFVHYIC